MGLVRIWGHGARSLVGTVQGQRCLARGNEDGVISVACRVSVFIFCSTAVCVMTERWGWDGIRLGHVAVLRCFGVSIATGKLSFTFWQLSLTMKLPWVGRVGGERALRAVVRVPELIVCQLTMQ